MAVFKFFKCDSPLPKPDGPLSAVVPSTSIAAANREVEHLLKAVVKEPGKRGRYDFFTPEGKAQIGKRAAEHGVTATIRFWARKFLGHSLKESTV